MRLFLWVIVNYIKIVLAYIILSKTAQKGGFIWNFLMISNGMIILAKNAKITIETRVSFQDLQGQSGLGVQPDQPVLKAQSEHKGQSGHKVQQENRAHPGLKAVWDHQDRQGHQDQEVSFRFLQVVK
jgi:hypothetical protein